MTLTFSSRINIKKYKELTSSTLSEMFPLKKRVILRLLALAVLLSGKSILLLMCWAAESRFTDLGIFTLCFFYSRQEMI